MAIVERVEAARTGEPRRLRVKSPATLEPVGEFDVTAPEGVREMVARARAAQPGWAALGFRARGRYLRRALKILLDRQDEFIRVIRGETGRSRQETLMIDILPVCDGLQYYSRRTARALRDRTVRPHLLLHKKVLIRYQPLGVVGVITPWNGPFVLSMMPVMQALMAGNAVVLKPSEVTPFSGRLVGDLFAEAELPADVLHVALGDGETGAALVEAEVDKISFTGSVRTGRRIGEACGRRLIPCTLELGGKDTMIVCADADLDRAVNGAVASSMINNGQVCVATERVYVAEPIAGEFTRGVVAKVESLRNGIDGDYDLGPLIWDRQLEVVERHIEDARARGATILTGGRRNPDLKGLFFEPTVLTGLTPDMAIMREETFGPIIPIVRFCDEEEAIQMANDSQYGLSGTVFTRDEERGRRIAARLHTGSVCLNDGCVTYGITEAPFGGAKDSGIGHVHGRSGLRGYARPMPIVGNRFKVKNNEFSWFPYTEEKAAKFSKAIRFLWGSPLRWLLS